MALPQDKRNKIDLRGLRVDDWVLINGKPHQLRNIAAKLQTEDGEFFLNDVKGIKLKPEDIEAAMKRVCAFDSQLRAEASEDGKGGFYIELFVQHEDEHPSIVNKPVRYYHELQHALYEVGIIIGLNYRWAELDKEDAEEVAEGKKEAAE